MLVQIEGSINIDKGIEIGSQLPAILIAGKNRNLTNNIMKSLKNSLGNQLACTSLDIAKNNKLETVMSLMKQRINRYRNHAHINDTKAVIIENVEALAGTTNGLIYLDYFFERARSARMIMIIRSTSPRLTSLLTDLSEKCSVRLVSEMLNQQDLELLAQPDSNCGLPSDEDYSFLIRQEGEPPQLLRLIDTKSKEETASELI